MRTFVLSALALALILFSGCSKPQPPQGKVTAPDSDAAKAEPAQPQPSERAMPEPAVDVEPGPPPPPAAAPTAARTIVLPEFKAIKEWNFGQLGQDQWAWQFPGEVKSTPDGAVYTSSAAEIGPRVQDAGIPADEVTHVVAAVSAAPAGDQGAAAVTGMTFFFNKSGNELPKDTPPTDDADSARFQPLPGRPDVYIARLSGLTNWSGTINECSIEVSPPEIPGVTAYDVVVSRIQFVTTKGAKPVLLPPPPPAAAKTVSGPVSEPVGPAVKAWDFASLGKDLWGWSFPAGQAKLTPEGAMFTSDKSCPGPQLKGAALPAADITHVCVKVSMKLQEQGTAIEPVTFRNLTFSFKGAAAATVPFAAVAGKEDHYAAALVAVPEWGGTIDECAVAFDIPDLAPDQIEAKTTYAITVGSITFVNAKSLAPAGNE